MTSRYSADSSRDDDVRVDSIDYILPHGNPPRQDDCVLHGDLPHNADPHIVVTQDALRQIDAHCNSDRNVELGGVLLGHAYQCGNRTYVEIEAAVAALSDDRGPVHFTFTADAWAQIHVDRAQYADLEIVGWFHTHPDLGVFFSADDEVVHAAAFTLPWHVALVVDPIRDQASFFGWENRRVVPLGGFYELIPATAGQPDQVPRSIVTWEIEIDEHWLHPPHRYASGIAPREQPLLGNRLAIALGIINLLLNAVILYIIFTRLL